MTLFPFFQHRREHGRFRQLPEKLKQIIFYAEDRSSWPHYESLIRELTDTRGHDICYLTSSAVDPILSSDNPHIHAFNIGASSVRTSVFLGVEAKVMIMTMPDLDTFYIKRSKEVKVHYVYLFHSIVSTHMIYRRRAFDHYDTVFCVGPHHVNEIRSAERVFALPPKNLVDHGYNRLETIIAERPHEGPAVVNDGGYTVLVAPSWGDEGVLEQLAQPLTKTLLDSGFNVIIRPHPMTIKRHPKILDELRVSFGGDRRFKLEVDISDVGSLHKSHVMISDWSGAALEYAFGLERPVLFLDMPRKVNNQDYWKLDIEPLEVWVRGEIGKVVAPDSLEQVPDTIAKLCADPAGFKQKVAKIRDRSIFNLGRSGQVAADHIERILDGDQHPIRRPPA